MEKGEFKSSISASKVYYFHLFGVPKSMIFDDLWGQEGVRGALGTPTGILSEISGENGIQRSPKGRLLVTLWATFLKEKRLRKRSRKQTCSGA